MDGTFFKALNVNESYRISFLILAISFYVLSLITWIAWIPYQKKVQNFFGHKIFFIPSKKYLWTTTFFLLFWITISVVISHFLIYSNQNTLLLLNNHKNKNFETQINQYFNNLQIILGSISSLFVLIWIIIQICRFFKLNKKISENFLNDWKNKSLSIEKEFGKNSEILNLNYGYNSRSCLRAITEFYEDINKTKNLEEKYYSFSDLIFKIMRFTFFLSKTRRKELLTNVYVTAWRKINNNE